MSADASVALIQALAALWNRIRALHPGVPAVVLVAAPAPHGKPNVMGHFAALRWSAKDDRSARLHEVVVVGEHLDKPVEETLDTLLHEAAHALNFERGIKDASANQYHNRHFKLAAEELGLTVNQVAHYGFAVTALPPETAARYQGETEDLRRVLIHRRQPSAVPAGVGPSVPPGGPPAPDSGGSVSRSRKAVCACPFIIRVSKSVIDATSIRCESCGSLFRLAD